MKKKIPYIGMQNSLMSDKLQRALGAVAFELTFQEFERRVQGVTAAEIEEWNLLPRMIFEARSHKAPVEPKVRWLLNHGANPNHHDTSGFSPLSEAARFKFPGVARMLVSAGADVNYKDSIKDTHGCGGLTALMHAVDSAKYTGDTSMIAVLIELKADPFISNENGHTVYDLVRPSDTYYARIMAQLPPAPVHTPPPELNDQDMPKLVHM